MDEPGMYRNCREIIDTMNDGLMVVSPDGSRLHAASRRGSATDAEEMGRDAAREVQAAAGPGFFDGIRT